MKTRISIKRIYDPVESTDGYRILVDRLWPRGISKERAHIALWLKEIAPSNELRTWFGHDPKKYTEFEKRYKHELKTATEAHAAYQKLQALCNEKHVTLVYAAHDTEHSNAHVLQKLMSA